MGAFKPKRKATNKGDIGMSNKYIIQNCPCYDYDYEECLNTFRDEYKKCYDCTDCLLKRIVDECKWETNNINIDLRGDLAERILSELDIQEFE